MISLIIPTHNRSHTLVKVLDSFFAQKYLTEIIIVDDASTEDLPTVLRPFTQKYPQIPLRLLRNDEKRGAAYCRQRGIQIAYGEYILFADDDLFLENNYTEVCLRKIRSGEAQIVSGRLCYRFADESIDKAISRFGIGDNDRAPFDPYLFRLNISSRFQGDLVLPFTHAVYLCSKELLQSIKIDPHYSKGNGFREETDPQVGLLARGVKIVMTNDTHCVHMHLSEVKSGGQRVGRFSRFYWNLSYTFYFLRKHYSVLKKHCRLSLPLGGAMMVYASLEFYMFFLRPFVILPQYLFHKLRPKT